MSGTFTLLLFATLPFYRIHTIAPVVLLNVMSLANVLTWCLVSLSTRNIFLNLTRKRSIQFIDVIRVCIIEFSYVIGALLITAIHMDISIGGSILLIFAFFVSLIAMIRLRKL